MITSSRLSVVALGLGCLVAASLVAAAVAADFPVPYRDDWTLLANVLAPVDAASFAARVNEHFIPLPWLLTWIHVAVEGAVGPLMLAVALAAQAAGAALAIAEIRRRWPNDAGTRRLMIGAALAILGFAYQLQSVVFDAAVMFPLVQTFAIAAVVCRLNAAEATRAASGRWHLAASLAAVGAVLSTTNGLAVPWLIVAMGLLDRTSWGRLVPDVAVGTLGVATFVATSRTASGLALDHPPRTAADAIGFLLAFPASFLAYLGAPVAIAAGTALTAAAVAVLWTAARRWPSLSRLERFAAALVAFAGVNGAMLAVARADFGIIQVAQSRYATWTIAGWTGLLLFAFSRWVPAPTSARRWPAVLVVIAIVALLPVHVFSILVWLAKADHLRVARLAVVVGVEEPGWTSSITAGRPIDDVVRLLRARHDPSVTDDRLGRPMRPASVGSCSAALALSRAGGGAGGWIVSGTFAEPAGEILITDRDGIVRGLARPAPVIDQADPRPIDVVRAVARRVRSRAIARGWIGFSQAGAGAPYTAIAIDDGRARCTSPVAEAS